MRTVEKISVALGPEDYAWAKERAKERGGSVSAVLSEALRRLRQAEARERLLAGVKINPALLADMERELFGAELPAPAPASPPTRGRSSALSGAKNAR